MTNFIEDNTGLSSAKTTLVSRPEIPDINKIKDTDWNGHRQALLDIQAWMRGLAKWHGLVEQAADPAPAGVSRYIWAKSDGTLHYKGSAGDIDLTTGGGAGEVVDLTQAPYSVVADTFAAAAANTAAINSAIATYSGTRARLLLPLGVTYVDMAGGGTDAWCVTFAGASDVELVGRGMFASKLSQYGAGDLGDSSVVLFDGSVRCAIHDLSIDQTQITSPDPGQHNHLISVYNTGGADSTRDIRGWNLYLGKSIGDQLRFFGDTNPVVNIEFHHLVMRGAGTVTSTPPNGRTGSRSGMAFQRGCSSVRIHHAFIDGVQNSPIDFEPSGTVSIEDVDLSELYIDNTTGNTAIAVALAGVSGGTTADRIRFRNSKVLNGAISCISTKDLWIDGVEVRTTQAFAADTNTPLLEFRQVNDDLRITDVTLDRGGTSANGNVFDCENTGTSTSIRSMRVTQATAGYPVVFGDFGGTNLSLKDIDVRYSAGSPGSFPAVYVGAVGANTTGLTIDDVRVKCSSGDMKAAVELQVRSPRTLSDVRVTNIEAVDEVLYGVYYGIGTTGTPIADKRPLFSNINVGAGALPFYVVDQGDNPQPGVVFPRTRLCLADFGAKGDGITDDTAAVLAAVQCAGNSTRQLFIGPGTFKLTTAVAVTLTNGIQIRGAGRSTIFRYASSTAGGPGLNAFEFTNSKDITIEHITFQGDSSDDYIDNQGVAIYVINSTDVTVRDCWFEQCGKPVASIDSFTSRRLVVENCVMHNCPNGLNPGSDATIKGCHFICDGVVDTRAQAIYSFGQQINVQIINCLFRNNYKEAIQIRAGNARFQIRDNFRIEGCHFENCASYAIWIGSDDHPDIGAGVVITGNTFKNCAGAVQGQGCRSAVITGNHVEIDWELPRSPVDFLSSANGILVTGGVGLSGHWQSTQSCVIANNKLIIRHPFVGTVKLTDIPVDGDTISIDTFTYTWRSAPSVAFDVQIGGTIAISVDNLRQAVTALDGLASAPNPVLRFVTDAMNNLYGASYGLTDFDTLVIAGWRTWTMLKSEAGTPYMTLTQAEDYRILLGNPIYTDIVISPLIEGNSMDDTGNILVQRCRAPTIVNNIKSTWDIPVMFNCKSNVLSRYSGNRCVEMGKGVGNRHHYDIIDDFAPVIEDPRLGNLQLSYPEFGLGTYGVISVGDGRAHTYLYYGDEITTPAGSPTLPWRWEDGDIVRLYNGAFTIFTFKRSAPGAGEFNDADGLVTLLDGAAGFDASYASYVDDLTLGNPKKLIRIRYSTPGFVDPLSTELVMRRWSTPTSGVDFDKTPQPMITGQFLRECESDPYIEGAHFYGGSATLTKTFVHSRIASKDRPVFVQGVDEASELLVPKVYQADIVPGVGFSITHGDASGTPTAKFFWRIG